MALRSGTRRLVRLLPVVIGAALWYAGCNSLELTSHWRKQPVVVDGKNDEWQNSLVRIEGKPVMIGLLNDSENLYIALVTDDRSIERQVLFRGMTVWLDRTGGEEKKFGIQFPLGFQARQSAGFLDARPTFNDQGGPPSGDSLRERFPIDSNDVEIIGPAENEHRRLTVAELKQIAVKVRISGNGLMYELRVPLNDSGAQPYAIGAAPGSTIGVGLETGARPSRPSSDQGTGEGRPGGGMGRGGFRGRGGMGGGERGNRAGQQAEPLSVWAKVHLAAGGSE